MGSGLINLKAIVTVMDSHVMSNVLALLSATHVSSIMH